MSDAWENVVVLSLDALRADHLSCYGYHRDTTPNIDELATEGVRYVNAYSTSSHTRESVPALLTGNYPDVAVDAGYRLSPDAGTVAEALSEAGIATGGFHSNPFVSRAYGFDRGFDAFDDDLYFARHRLIALVQRALDKLRDRHYARAETINERSLNWIDSLDGERFFLWNHYMDTHGPYEPPDGFETAYTDRPVPDRKAQSLYQRAVEDPESITDDERRLLVDLYDSEIRYADEQVGAMLESLRERDLLSGTVLVVTADHGDAFGERGYYEHPRYLHDEVTRVPLIVRPPGGTGRTVETPVTTLDVAATVLGVVGRENEADGTPLFDLPDGDRTVYLQARGEDEHDHLRRYALRTRDGACFCELDRETGAIEFAECSTPSLRDDLEAHGRERSELEGEATSSKPAEVDGEVDRRLSALGYKD